jgi:cytochrome c peroxidase
MGMANHQAALDKIKNNEKYIDLYKRAFPEDKEPINIDNTADAIAAFEMTLESLDSAYDKGEMSDLAKKGYEQFKSVGCVACHSGKHFAGPELPVGTGFCMKFPTFPSPELEKEYGFSKDLGRFEVTKKEADKNMWRVPTLRNVAETAPYFHNGSVKDLKAAIKVMGKTQLNVDLTEDQVASIYAFLDSLTGVKPIITEPAPL